MGVGKSVIFYYIADMLKGPILLCSFKYVLYQHLDGIGKFIPNFVPVLISKNSDDIPELDDSSILLLTPEIMVEKGPILSFIPFSLICLDESQMFKNPTTIRSATINTICEMQPKARKLLLTATPCPENIGELQPQMQCLSKNILGTGKQFRKAFQRKRLVGSYWKDYYIKKADIKKRVAPFIFTKPEKDLPLPDQPVKKILIDMPLKLRNCYNEYKNTCIVEVDTGASIHKIISTQMYSKFLQICAGIIIDTKMSKALSKTIVYRLSDFKAKLIEDIVATLDHPVLIWGVFKEELRLIHKTLSGSALIMGGTKNGKEILADFKKGNIHALVANTQCLGAGLSLEIAGYQIAASRDPSCCRYLQSVGRTRRITQTKKVIRYEIIYKNTMEARLYKKVQKKVWKQNELISSLWKEEIKQR